MNSLHKLTAAVVLAGVTGLASAADYTGLYVFGDSLSDPGNLAALTNAWQVVSGNSYIPSAPYASGQFTNGNVWARTFANSLGLGAYGQALAAGGGNFAFGGARVATDGAGLPPSLATQTNLFLSGTGGVADSGALYVVAGGGNDARDALIAAGTAVAMAQDPTAGIAQAAGNYAFKTGQIIDQLQAAGAKKIIVWDVPNLALAPAVTAQGAGASFLAGVVAQAMNGALNARLSIETGVTLFDLYGIQSAISANPAAYGLSNVSDACGAVANCPANTYLYWDGIHPTAAAHALLAREMSVTAVPEPTTWVLLASGLMLIALRSRRRAPAQADAQAGV